MTLEHKERRNRVMLYTLGMFFLLSIVFFLVTFIIQFNTLRSSQQVLLQGEETLLNAEINITELSIGHRLPDTLFICDSMKYMQTEEQGKEYIQDLWLAFSKRKGIYDQIRFIDTEGNEVIRINCSGATAHVVLEEDLQNKSGRDYVEEALKLGKGQIYISAIDLNVENGVVETPYKPMIRFSTPVYADDGTLQGVVVLNYLANDLIDQMSLSNFSSYGHLNILNQDGYWVYNPSAPEKEWGFMFSEQENVSFSNEYPDIWAQVYGNESGTLITDQGVFIYTALISDETSPLQTNKLTIKYGGVNMYLLVYLPADSEAGTGLIHPVLTSMQQAFGRFVYVYFMILLIAAVIALLVVTARESREQIRYFSQFDTMTGVYNRRAGMERLRMMIDRRNADNCQLSICFIDINGLKQVNDSLGHESGDELIMSVVSGIKQHIRQNDFMARLGGDEFLIIFEGLSAEGCEMVWQRVTNAYREINETEERPYLISASHGIENLNCQSYTSLDDAINAADQKMYDEKRKMKQTLTVIRNAMKPESSDGETGQDETGPSDHEAG